MIKILIITLSITLSVLMVSCISWFKKEELKLEAINKVQLEDIEKLKKIVQINVWLHHIIKPLTDSIPTSANRAEKKLVQYFDRNSEEYNLQVSHYIYEDDISKYLDNSYKVDRYNAKQINDLMNINYKSGFLQFIEFNMNKKDITGTFKLIQPYKGEHNAS